jgi:hypothetical protein
VNRIFKPRQIDPKSGRRQVAGRAGSSGPLTAGK